MSLLSQTLAAISPLSRAAASEADARQALLTKPAGPWDASRTSGSQLARHRRVLPAARPAHPAIAVFAADHGVHAQGVTPWPQEVTAQMVANLAAGGAVVNALARQIGASVTVVDVGVADRPARCPEPVAAQGCPRHGGHDPGAGDEPGAGARGHGGGHRRGLCPGGLRR